MRIKHRDYNGNVHAVSCLPSGRYCECSVMGGNSFSQWQVSVGSLLLAGDVFYGRACGGVIWIQTTQGNPPDGGRNSVYIC